MPLAVINRVNVLGHAKWSMLVFTDCLEHAIGNYTPTVNEFGEEDESVVPKMRSCCGLLSLLYSTASGSE
jgi:hypothetical protein